VAADCLRPNEELQIALEIVNFKLEEGADLLIGYILKISEELILRAAITKLRIHISVQENPI